MGMIADWWCSVRVIAICTPIYFSDRPWWRLKKKSAALPPTIIPSYITLIHDSSSSTVRKANENFLVSVFLLTSLLYLLCALGLRPSRLCPNEVALLITWLHLLIEEHYVPLSSLLAGRSCYRWTHTHRGNATDLQGIAQFSLNMFYCKYIQRVIHHSPTILF